MKIFLAQSVNINGQNIEGPLKTIGGQPIEKLSDVVNIVLVFIYPLAGILLFLFLVMGGYDYLLSGGNAEKVKAGQAKIASALIGFFLLITSYLAVRVIAYVFGLGGGLF